MKALPKGLKIGAAAAKMVFESYPVGADDAFAFFAEEAQAVAAWRCPQEIPDASTAANQSGPYGLKEALGLSYALAAKLAKILAENAAWIRSLHRSRLCFLNGFSNVLVRKADSPPSGPRSPRMSRSVVITHGL